MCPDSDAMQRQNAYMISTESSATSDIVKDSSSATPDSVNDMSKKPVSISIDPESKQMGVGKRQDELEFKILCLNLRVFPEYVRFLLCCAAVFIFYVAYGYCQVSEVFEPLWYMWFKICNILLIHICYCYVCIVVSLLLLPVLSRTCLVVCVFFRAVVLKVVVHGALATGQWNGP